MSALKQLTLIRRGLVPYEEALNQQRQLHLEVAQGLTDNSLILLQHPSVFTAGKRTLDSELPQDGEQVIRVDRGGKVTWHGPGQIVGYPIIKLSNPHELVGFVRELESALIEVCAFFEITATRVSGRSGVWICDERGERKIAAIGIRVASGVTMHGFALNVSPDLAPFTQIIPCGIDDAAVTSMQIELGKEIDIDAVQPIVEKYMSEYLAKVSA
jgi:lipoyl(octanoyl) transferase